MLTVAVLGAGSWGTALSIVLADNGHDVKLWTHRKEQADIINEKRINSQYLNVALPDNIEAYSEIKPALKGVDAILIVVPSSAIREVCSQIKDLRSEEHTSELQSRGHLVCRLLLEKKNTVQDSI